MERTAQSVKTAIMSFFGALKEREVDIFSQT